MCNHQSKASVRIIQSIVKLSDCTSTIESKSSSEHNPCRAGIAADALSSPIPVSLERLHPSIFHTRFRNSNRSHSCGLVLDLTVAETIDGMMMIGAIADYPSGRAPS